MCRHLGSFLRTDSGPALCGEVTGHLPHPRTEEKHEPGSGERGGKNQRGDGVDGGEQHDDAADEQHTAADEPHSSVLQTTLFGCFGQVGQFAAVLEASAIANQGHTEDNKRNGEHQDRPGRSRPETPDQEQQSDETDAERHLLLPRCRSIRDDHLSVGFGVGGDDPADDIHDDPGTSQESENHEPGTHIAGSNPDPGGDPGCESGDDPVLVAARQLAAEKLQLVPLRWGVFLLWLFDRHLTHGVDVVTGLGSTQPGLTLVLPWGFRVDGDQTL